MRRLNDEALFGSEALIRRNVLVVPGWSEVLPHELDNSTSIAGIELALLHMVAAMDAVVESSSTITIALVGGTGVPHGDLTVTEKDEEVDRVKWARTGPVTTLIARLAPDRYPHDVTPSG